MALQSLCPWSVLNLHLASMEQIRDFTSYTQQINPSGIQPLSEANHTATDNL